MSCSCKGFGGFGLDVPVGGEVAHADPNAPHFCSNDGDPRALQQMLTDLGFYHGPIGIAVGMDAMVQLATAGNDYMKSKGISLLAGQPVACSALIADWQALKARQRNWLLGGLAAVAVAAYLIVGRR